MGIGVSYDQHFTHVGSFRLAVGTSVVQGTANPLAGTIRIHTPDTNSGTVWYKAGSGASGLTIGGADETRGVPLEAGTDSGWIPVSPGNVYFVGSGAGQEVYIEMMG